MPSIYAKDKLRDFKNCFENVAVAGAGGQIGSVLTKALLATGKHSVTALSRVGSNTKLPDGVKAVPIDYDQEDTLVEALKGHDILIIALATSASLETHQKLARSAAEAGITWIMPSCHGGDLLDETWVKQSPMGPIYKSIIQTVEDVGVSWISLGCGFWYELSLAMGEVTDCCFGIQISKKKAVFCDEGKQPLNVSTWDQCGRAVAALLSLKELPEDEDDGSLTVSRWRNSVLPVSSFYVSQREILDSVQRIQGTTDAEWELSFEPSRIRYDRGIKEMQQGNMLGFATAMFAQPFLPENDNRLPESFVALPAMLGLPKEDIDDATKSAFQLVKGMLKSK